MWNGNIINKSGPPPTVSCSELQGSRTDHGPQLVIYKVVAWNLRMKLGICIMRCGHPPFFWNVEDLDDGLRQESKLVFWMLCNLVTIVLTLFKVALMCLINDTLHFENLWTLECRWNANCSIVEVKFAKVLPCEFPCGGFVILHFHPRSLPHCN